MSLAKVVQRKTFWLLPYEALATMTCFVTVFIIKSRLKRLERRKNPRKFCLDRYETQFQFLKFNDQNLLKTAFAGAGNS